MGVKPLIYSFMDFEDFTDNFSADNIICNYQFGQLYRGVIDDQRVVVKRWVVGNFYAYSRHEEGDFIRKFHHEINIFQNPKMTSHPLMVDLLGYCDEGDERLAMVLNLNAVDSLYNLKDELSWVQRMNVIVGFGFFLKAMHGTEGGQLPCLLGNFDPHHILLDKDYNPKLEDLNMSSVGEFPKKPDDGYMGIFGCFGYCDPSVLYDGWSEKVDVFSFGLLVMFLIGKEKFFDDISCKTIGLWAIEEYIDPEKLRAGSKGYVRPRSSNVVDKSLRKGQVGYYHKDCSELSELAINCLEYYKYERPTMKDVVDVLENLSVVCYFGNIHELKSFKYK